MTQGTSPLTQDALDARLTEHRQIWDVKPTLRAIYTDFHKRLDAACPPGRLLDIGGGSAHFKSYRPDTTSLDILPFPGIDVVADAHDMPFEDASFSGIVMLDVLHHLQKPIVFLREAARVLKPGGRLAMIEPGMSPVSRIFYSNFHQEPVVMSADPFAETTLQSGDDPFDSNQAIPTLLFRDAAARQRVEQAVPGMKVVDVTWLSLFAYPLSGGFKSWCLWPHSLVNPMLKIEGALMPALGPVLGFRHLIVLERR
ncbi:MAG: class I SAM-dependent methyltransferase [Hyphomicrobium sp.]